MMVKKFAILCCVCMMLPFHNPSDAQSFPAYELLPAAPSDWNYDYLNALIKKGIDSVRQLYDAEPLNNHKILFDAALQHAQYLNERKILSHYQKEFPEFREPHDRVQHFGGKAFTMSGENVAVTYALSPVQGKEGSKAHTNLTYSQLAFDFVNMWVHSPGHFRNMITKEFNQTGVATVFNPSDNSVRAVQVFGRLEASTSTAGDFEYDFEKMRRENSGLKSPETLIPLPPHADVHDWKIEDGRNLPDHCRGCRPGNHFLDVTQLWVEDNKVWLYTDDVNFIKNVVQHHGDGFAAEFVSYTAFDCYNPQFYTNLSRRNEGCIFNGRITEPVLGKDALKGIVKVKDEGDNEEGEAESPDRKKKKQKSLVKRLWSFFFPKYKTVYYKQKIAEIPQGLTGCFEINLLVLKKKKLCNVIHFASLCGEKMTFSPEFRRLEPSFTKPWSAPSVVKKFSIRLPFEKNKSEAAAGLFRQQLGAIRKNCDKIDSVRISAFSSVEGDHKVNEELQLKRAHAITGIIRESQMDTLISQIRTAENWEMMHQQIQSTRKLDWLKNKSMDEIEDLVSQEKNLPLAEPFLRLQRYAQIDMTGTRTEKPRPDISWLSKKAGRYFAEIKKSKGDYTATAYRDSLRDLQTYVYELIRKKEGSLVLLEKLKIPDHPLFTEFLYRRLWCKHAFSSLPERQKDSIFFRELSAPALLNEGYFAPRYSRIQLGMQHNFLRFGNYKEVKKNIKDCRNLLNSAPDSLRETISQYLLAMHMKAIDFYASNPLAYRNSRAISISFIYDFWKSKEDISDSLALRICHYLISLSALPYARDMIFDRAMKEKPMPELLMQAIKLSFAHPDDELNFHEFRQFLLRSRQHLSKGEWCGMFTGPCNLSFQVWDDPDLRDYYCRECADQTNYAESIFDPIPDSP